MDLQNIFLTLWNMSLTGSIVILFVLLARLFLRKSPRVFSYALWAVVLFRLLCPVSISSMFSVLTFTKAAEPVVQSVVTTMDYSAVEMPEFIPMPENEPEMEEPVVFEPESNESRFETPVIPPVSAPIPEVMSSEIKPEPARDPLRYAVIIWLTGLGVMLVYNVYSGIRLLRQIEGAVHLRKELYLADYIPTAFVLGIISPKIYLPSFLSPTEQGYIVAHERCHIKRMDHVFRLLAYLALCLHWFNPLVWVAFVLSGKDMEMSCDEAVLRMYGTRIRAEYAQSLLRLATGHRSLALTPLAFGEGDTKERVVNMSKWKKPKIWATVAALIACVAVLVACAVNPAGGEETATEPFFDRNKDVDQICIDAIDELLDAESYYILYEKEYADESDTVEYRRHGNNQLILCKENKTNNRVYSEGRLGIYQAEPWSSVEAWVWLAENETYDPDDWLREWSPKYLETGSIRVGEKSISVDVEWPHPVNEKRYYKGEITYYFKPGGALDYAQREAVLMEGHKLMRGYVDKITVMEEEPAAIEAKIRDTAILCINDEEFEEQKAAEKPEKVLASRDNTAVRTVDELLAAIRPNTVITLEGGIYNLSKASNYGRETGSDYYYWRKVGDGYELVIKNLDNFVINGAGVNATTIETDPRSANVLHMETCYDVFLQNFTAGHTERADLGECGGGVIKLTQCSDVEMQDLGLFGCGIEGLITEQGRNITLKNSAIYDCSSSAVVLNSTDTVTVTDCNIYNIGAEPEGGYSIFTIERSSDVTIEGCNIADSQTKHFLLAQNNIVTVKNCLVSNNRFENSVLSIVGWNVTLSQNRFRDNSIRNWYRQGSTEALDENGKVLTEELLDEMYGILPQAPSQPQLQIRVSTVDEFLAAIGPNKEIVLEPGTYNLRTATGYGSAYNDYYFWNDTFVDGLELVIRNVDNMTIRGGGTEKTDVTVEAEPRYANVLNFYSCSNITVSGITAGHTKEQGSCTGGVLFFKDSDYVLAENCGLFGCGTEGVYAEDSGNIMVMHNDIYDCSQGGVEFRNCNIIRLESNTFRRIAGSEYILMLNCIDVQIDGDAVIGEKFWGSYEAATAEQVERNALELAVGGFVYNYFWDNQEEMQEFLAQSYQGVGVTYNDGEPSYKGMHYEVTFDHVTEIKEKGYYTFEIPYRPYRYEDGDKHKEIRYLLVTVVKENGEYKISDYQLKK